MEEQKPRDHIATLCAAGTLGVAAAGFALVSQDRSAPNLNELATEVSQAIPDGYPITLQTSIRSPLSNQRPATSITIPPEIPSRSSSISLFKKRQLNESRPESAHRSDTSDSRGSSLNRSLNLRPRTADTRSTSDRRDTSTGSSWLKRISQISSSTSNSHAISLDQSTISTSKSISRPPTSHSAAPNKLVKRSTSHSGLAYDPSKMSFIRRPATSHQRAAAAIDSELVRPHNGKDSVDLVHFGGLPDSSLSPKWRPFFHRGFPAKRHSISGPIESSGPRLITSSNKSDPVLVLGSSIQRGVMPKTSKPQISLGKRENTFLPTRHKLRRSLSSMNPIHRHRYFSDPSTRSTFHSPSIVVSSPAGHFPISPLSDVSAFEVGLPSQSPIMSSSPPSMPKKHRFSLRKRESNVPSDPTTLSSDNDTRIFTDDESIDYQSDTAYDSLATRGTANSKSGSIARKLETIFTDTTAVDSGGTKSTLEHLVYEASLHDSDLAFSSAPPGWHHDSILKTKANVTDENFDLLTEDAEMRTPIKSSLMAVDEILKTPVPSKSRFKAEKLHVEEDDNIDWSPKSDLELASTQEFSLVHTRQSAIRLSSTSPTPNVSSPMGSSPPDKSQRMSIFDWSENKRSTELSRKPEIRPRTVHGKQAHDNNRSRSSGRKALNQMHLRSQSVPSNKNTQGEQATPGSSKYGTWGLGRKPVSEEWSEDFEFDDVDEEDDELPILVNKDEIEPMNRGSLRGVKVPQSIIDRQASVHVQFGQVQEFMMLVEELKRLRLQGATLNLLDSHAKQLWEDAESIINLATINNEDDDFAHVRHRSPSSADIFGEDLSINRGANATNDTSEGNEASTIQMPSTSPRTSPSGRPRGESLVQAKNFLQSMHQTRAHGEYSPEAEESYPQKKLPFDTQDLKDLVVRSGVITRALKEVVRKAEGVTVSPTKTPPSQKDPAFSHIFTVPDVSPCPPYRKPPLPKSRSANSYLNGHSERNNSGDVHTARTLTAMV